MGRPRAAREHGSIPAHAGEPSARVSRSWRAWVDPRPRGGAALPASPSRTAGGRSPPTRGSRAREACVAERVGSIPAHAGEPASPRTSTKTARVDPRPRGGAYSIRSGRDGSIGRSPPTRGSRVSGARVVPRGGSIPAHAGEPPARAPRRGASRVDPRPRGGAIAQTMGALMRTGRSPPTRGSRWCRLSCVSGLRSIPAHAGEPLNCGSPGHTRRVDPRPRGGAPSRETQADSLPGRSPPTRGSLAGREAMAEPLGSIPAHAGEPVARRRTDGRRRVDPRPRGGATGLGVVGLLLLGRSPPTRGSPRELVVAGVEVGSIPAHAGEPRHRPPGGRAPRVDPRPRGGAEPVTPQRSTPRGRSPPTRGSPTMEPNGWRGEGSIPAHAGEPGSRRPASSRGRVDPRPRGGALGRPGVEGRAWGRSPPTRGSRREEFGAPAHGGSIPAHAGEPAHARTRPDAPGVDPRPRGGALHRREELREGIGRSPPTRGSHRHARAKTLAHGSIPAHAGEPSRRDSGSQRARVDPRPRGGAVGGRCDREQRAGRSPPTRGSREHRARGRCARGSIPAHAGEP